jgi:hypothetical protein
MIDLHPQNKSLNIAPKAAPIDPAVVAFAQGESPAEQLRVVFILNLPSTIGLEQISNAIKEGPVLKVVFGNDTDNGNRFAGVIFQVCVSSCRFMKCI